MFGFSECVDILPLACVMTTLMARVRGRQVAPGGPAFIAGPESYGDYNSRQAGVRAVRRSKTESRFRGGRMVGREADHGGTASAVGRNTGSTELPRLSCRDGMVSIGPFREPAGNNCPFLYVPEL